MNTLVHLFAPEEVGRPDGDGKEVPATIKSQQGLGGRTYVNTYLGSENDCTA